MENLKFEMKKVNEKLKFKCKLSLNAEQIFVKFEAISKKKLLSIKLSSSNDNEIKHNSRNQETM